MVELIVIVILGIILYKIVIHKDDTPKKSKKSFYKPYNDTWKQKNISTKDYKKQYDTAVGSLISTKEVAQHFNITQKHLHKIFEELDWIEIRGQWILTRVKGNFNGARQKYNAQTKMKYVLWEDDVLENEELIKKIAPKATYNTQNTTVNNPIKKSKSTNNKTTYQEKVTKGKEYEEFVAKVYRSRGYHVTEYGKIKGKEDHGIDLIAKKEKEIVLIQCKNWKENGKWEIKHKDIKAFQTDARTFVEDKPLLRSCLLTARYTISGDFIHHSAIKHIEEMQKLGKRVDYEIVKIF